MNRRIVAVVPSLAAPAELGRELAALRAELATVGAGLVWVHQGSAAPPAVGGAQELCLELPSPVGFARAVHAGIAACGGATELVAVINDDLEVETGWAAALVAALDGDAGLAAVQGVHLRAAEPGRLDGCGIGWNRWLQAVQIGDGLAPPARGAPPFPVFGVSATGALYRRAALDAVAFAPGRPFDERLGSWYEDVDLAVRLRSRGWRAACVPAARARHRGSATGAGRPFDRARRIAGNRWLVVARLLGRRFPLALPKLLARDLADAARALGAGELRRAAAYPAGWAVALARLAGFARLGRPLVDPRELGAERVGSAT